ncbi:adenylosuccinate lyase [Maribacter sp. 2304DJ31-5]|uniref:adenylosuccinate lyase n=1 Tax=Maribacter sp. 2304DJ31-5 TaxID=3386273 RepID=UPI0039BC623F
MTATELYDILNYVDHSREKRLEMAHMVSNNPRMIEPLLCIALQTDDPISSKACWVLEFTAKQDLSCLFPFMDLFMDSLPAVRLESSIRPFAKICEYLAISYFKDKNPRTQKNLSESHLEKMATACFDWLIGDYKVAAKAYSMTSLVLLGSKFDWINPELKMVLEQNYALGSAAYKARARMILSKLRKKGL